MEVIFIECLIFYIHRILNKSRTDWYNSVNHIISAPCLWFRRMSAGGSHLVCGVECLIKGTEWAVGLSYFVILLYRKASSILSGNYALNSLVNRNLVCSPFLQCSLSWFNARSDTIFMKLYVQHPRHCLLFFSKINTTLRFSTHRTC